MSSPVTSNPTPATTTPFLSVVIPACNPGMRHLGVVLEALRHQTLPKNRWELIVVDDASRTPLKAVKRDRHEALGERRGGGAAEGRGGGSLVASSENEKEPENDPEVRSYLVLGSTKDQRTKNEALIDLSWHPNARLVETDPEREGLGLVSARLRGFELGKGDVFVFVDQDNALRPDYLQGVADIAVEYPHIGTWGGQILLKFDEPDKAPPKWLQGGLCTRELQSDVWSNVVDHHDSTPWGAGLCAKREVLEVYRRRVAENPLRRLLDPTPRRAGFGGDSDLAYAGITAGYGKGAFKRLILDHLIPVGRCSDSYLLKNAETNGYSTRVHSFVETGTITPVRSDLRHWCGLLIHRFRMKPIEWKMFMARRRGQLSAVTELSDGAAALREYANRLQMKAERLGG
jgi:glycosyltransferase involved in cell wall biosynthesis